MKYLTLLIPTVLSLTLLWWNGHLFWMFWLVAAIAALTWICVKARSSSCIVALSPYSYSQTSCRRIPSDLLPDRQ